MARTGGYAHFNGGRWARRLVGSVAFGIVGLSLAIAAPGVALADPTPDPTASSTVGSAQPRVVGKGDDAQFTITCGKPSTSATLTGTWLGLPSNTAMDMVTPTLFQFDIIVPGSAPHGKHPVRMQCSDGTSADVTIIVSSS
jgi:hypothetical protein